MNEPIVRLPALRGPLAGEAVPAGLAVLPRLWPGLPQTEAGGAASAGRGPAPQGPWFYPDNFPLTPPEALACLRDLQAMTEAALSGVPLRAWQSRQGAALREQAESAARRAFAAAQGNEQAALARAAEAEARERLCRAQRLLLLGWLQEERLAEMATLNGRYADGRARLEAALGAETPDLPESPRPAAGRQEADALASLLPPWDRMLEAACHFLPDGAIIVAEAGLRAALLEREDLAPCADARLADLAGPDGPRLTGLRAPLWRLLRRPRPPRCCPHWEREFALLTWEEA